MRDRLDRHDVRPEEYQCGHKVRYFSKAVAKLQRKRFRRKRNSLQVYHCPHCGFWHLGRKLR